VRLIELRHTINGEQFNLEINDGVYVLTHERWSLIGCGYSLLDAEVDLLKGAKSVFECLLDIPVSELDSDALDLRCFLFSV